MPEYTHDPVLLAESIEALELKPGDRVLDCTLGLGGHASAFADIIGESGELVALDADEINLESARKRLAAHKNLRLIHTNFGDVAGLHLGSFDAVFADLGLSSPHVDDPERGFSFRSDAPLDFRFDRTKGETAADLIAGASADDIARWLRSYGEVKQAWKIALELKANSPQTTGDLRAAVEKVCGYLAPKVLPQVFQAVRIVVNDEMGVLDRLLALIPDLLAPGGRIAVLSYHSLEDRPVKQMFRALSTAVIDETTGAEAQPALFELAHRKPIVPTESEINRNPRSRSAKLRTLRRRNNL